jgi:hypothetical protein
MDADRGGIGPRPTERTERTLSTGHTVELPLDCEFTLAGGLFTASARRLSAHLPTRLSPVRVGPQTGAVALVGIEYHRVGGLDPYDEFAVVVPVVADARTDLPGVQLLGADLGGWVHWLPVTTEASVALGREVWGYPKEVADVEIAERGGVRHATVAVDGERVVSLDVRTAATSDREMTLGSYTELDGRLCRTRVDLGGPFALKPLSQRASFTLGGHDRADRLRELGLRRTALGRLYGPRMRARLHPGRRLGV